MRPRSTIAWPRRVTEWVCDGSRMNGGKPTGAWSASSGVAVL